MSDRHASDQVDEVVSSYQSQKYPLINQGEHAEKGQGAAAGRVRLGLLEKNEAGSNMTRVEKIIGIVIRHRQRWKSRVSKEKALHPRHEKSILDSLITCE
jgi:hypothetical protein